MSKELQRMIVLDAVLIVLATAITLHLTEDGLEFWVNRYQTLIGSLTAVGAAWYAGVWVKRQIDATNAQTRIMAGLGDPEFYLRPGDGAGEIGAPINLILTCVNEYKHAIEIRKITCKHPPGVEVAYARDASFRLKGTRPQAEVASEGNFKISFFGTVPANKVKAGLTGVRLDITYMRYGADPTIEHARVMRVVPVQRPSALTTIAKLRSEME